MLAPFSLFPSPQVQPALGRALSEGFIENNGVPAGLWLPLSDNRAFDWSTNNNHGTLAGGVTPSANGWGVLGSSWALNGTNGYISTVSAFPNYSAVTVAILVQLAAATNCTLIDKDDNIANRAWTIDFQGSRFRWFINGGANGLVSSAATYTTGIWYLIVGTCNGPSLNLYVNGSSAGSGTNTGGIPANSQPVLIGQIGSSRFAKGYVPFVCVWPSALSAAQVSSLYNALRTGEPYPLFAPSVVERIYSLLSGGPQAVSVPPVDVAPSAVAPTVTLGPVSPAASPLDVAVSIVAPTISLGAVSLAAGTVDVFVSSVAPSLMLGAVSVSPGIASVAVDDVAPAIALGAVSAAAPAISVAVDAIAPSVSGGPISADAGTVLISVDAAPPTISLGTASVLAGVVSTSIDVSAPTIAVGSISVAAGVFDVLVEGVSPFTQPPQSVAAGVVDVAAVAAAPSAGYVQSYPALDVWTLDARPSLWILEP